jgi:predicted outer membrane repeat protein
MRLLAFALAVVAGALVAGSAHAAGFSVSVPYDAVDAAPGDGLCDDGTGQCTLRAAVMEANALPGWDDIKVPPDHYPLTDTGAGEDFAKTGDLDITSHVGIWGSDPLKTRVDGIGADRVFHVHPRVRAFIEGIGIQGGREIDGAGILLQYAYVRMNDVFFVANNAARGGGGLYSFESTVALTQTTFADDTARDFGGAIFVGGTGWSSANAFFENITVSGNWAGRSGGGIYASIIPVRLNNVTVANNRAGRGGGIYSAGTSPDAFNSIVAYNGGGDCFGALASGGNNNDTDWTCGLAAAGDLPGVDPLLDGLTIGLGPTPVRPLLGGSPAIDAGNNLTCASVDQRYLARPQGPACDMGAVEMP